MGQAFDHVGHPPLDHQPHRRLKGGTTLSCIVEWDVTIKGIHEVEFRDILRTHLTSAKAISDPQYLRGRQAKLTQIDRAFNSPGKHVFIYGDRGVGKTSLALTAAVLH